jgi:hypothetical protein
MRSIAPALAAAALAFACAAPEEPDPFFVEPLAPPDPSEGFQMKMSAIAPAGEEIWKCEIFRGLNADGAFAYVNSAESRQTPLMHHADLGLLLFAGVEHPPGKYDCQELYDAYPNLMEDAIFVFASQLEEDRFELPEGIVAPLPVDTPYMYEMHYFNITDEDMEVVSYLNAYTIPEEEKTGAIYGNVNRDLDINVPPHVEDHVEWTRCVFNEDAEVLFLQTHTHELARRAEIYHFDGTNTGDLVYVNRDWHAPEVKRITPGIQVAAGEGFEYRCVYDSNRDTVTHWGFGAADEMCQFGYVFIPGDPDIECVTVEDGVASLDELEAR